MNFGKIRLIAAIMFVFIAAQITAAQTTAFNYQGKLTDGGAAANGAFQMQFKLFDAASGGSQIGATLADVPVTAENGVFAVKLDFGASAFSGANRFLEIAVRRNANESYTTLSPREQITSSPYAVRTLSAAQADVALDAQKLGGVAASEYVTNTNAGSAFIRNQTNQQTGNFNISGNGTIGTQLGVGRNVTPGIRIDSQGTIRAVDNISTGIIAETTGGTNSWAKFYMISPSRRWSIGTSQNFNGDQFYLNDETAGQTRMAIATNGNVGFGTTAPNTRLTLNGGVSWTGAAWTASMNMQNLSALGWEANASGQRFGIGQTNGGLYFFRTNSAFGNVASPATYDMVISDAGNVGIGTPTPVAKLSLAGNAIQNRDSGGFAKAMIYIDANGTIIRCYNGVTGSSSGNCGFSVNNSQFGVYFIDFGFQVSDRFFYLTGGAPDRVAIWNSNCQGCNANQLLVYVVNTAGVDVNGRFMAIVF